jgi:uncharacterized protein (TIGR02594 family)
MKKAPSNLMGGSVGKGGRNNKNDVRAVQTLLNLPTNMALSGLKKPLEADGELGKATQDAIDLYQRNVMKMKIVDGRVDRSGSMILRLEQGLPPMPSLPFSQPKWLEIACAEEKGGIREEGGRERNNQRILTYLSSVKYLSGIDDKINTKVKDAAGNDIWENTGYKLNQVDETAWCACFVNWCLEEAGELSLKKSAAGAEYWKSYGKGGDLMIGNICVIHRDKFSDSSSGWHVGFYIGGNPSAGYAALLGGNQGNSVCRRWYVGFIETFQRWPG